MRAGVQSYVCAAVSVLNIELSYIDIKFSYSHW